MDVVNIDQLATQVVNEAEPGARLHWMDDAKAIELWDEMLLELGETRWDAEFLHDEWSQVVLGQAITSREEYFRARRAGRGRQLNRAQRAAIWQLVEQFTKRLDEANLWTFRQVAAHAARLERQRAATRAPRYRHIVVDEAQDLSSAHWMLLRAMVGQGPNDLFLAGDTHQRIYDNYVSLGSLGIEIRGRSSRLTLTYRSTHEILTAASRILGTEAWDDMDDGTDTLDGYRSVLRGPQPEFRAYGSWQDELDGILRQVQEWTGGDTSIAVSVPTKKQRRAGGELPVRSRRARRVDRPGRAASARRSARRDPAAVQGARVPADDPRRDHRRGRPRPVRHRRPGASAARADASTVTAVRRGHPGAGRAGDLLARAAQPFPPPGVMRTVLYRYALIARSAPAGWLPLGVHGPVAKRKVTRVGQIRGRRR